MDRESYSLQRFLDFVLAGQPLALEMLFAPDAVMTMPPDPLWRAVQALAPRLVSRQATPFLRYSRLQAERYGSKGARAAAARQALALLEAAETAQGTTARLAIIEATLAAFAAGPELTEEPPGTHKPCRKTPSQKFPHTGPIRQGLSLRICLGFYN